MPGTAERHADHRRSQHRRAYAYGLCAQDPFLFTVVYYCATGTAGTCSFLEVVPSPSSLSGTIEGTDCSNQKQIADGWILLVNSDGSCLCGRTISDPVAPYTGTVLAPAVGPCPDCIVPVESSTWGQVKSLYE